MQRMTYHIDYVYADFMEHRGEPHPSSGPITVRAGGQNAGIRKAVLRATRERVPGVVVSGVRFMSAE